jgi:hypothetical protein
MRIFDIEIYRDGGSIEFRLEKNFSVRYIWLETPFHGEPRALLIDSKPVQCGSSQVRELLADIDVWWSRQPRSIQVMVSQVMAQTGPFFNPSSELADAISISRVLRVRDYVLQEYVA